MDCGMKGQVLPILDLFLMLWLFFFSVNMRKLMSILDQQQLANLCRVLSFSLADLESVEERSTRKFQH